MEKIRVMVVGLPNPIAESVADWIAKTPEMILLPFTLSDWPGKLWVGQNEIFQIAPQYHRERLKEICPDVIVDLSDLTHPERKKRNSQFYCDCDIPFLMVSVVRDSGLSEKINKLGLSVFIVPQDEIQKILEAIRCLKERGSGSTIMTIRPKKINPNK